MFSEDIDDGMLSPNFNLGVDIKRLRTVSMKNKRAYYGKI